MATVDKAAFSRELRVWGVRVPKQECQVALRLLDRQLLDVPRMRAVREVPDNPDYRCVMLHQDVTGQELNGLGENLRELVRTRGWEPMAVSLALSYEHLTAEQVLRQLLPQGIDVPSSFETVGHVAHVNLRAEQLPHKALIGQVLLEKSSPQIKTVVNKVGVIESEFRVPTFELLAGQPSLETEVRQYGALFRLNFGTVYWNSRLEREHSRLVDLLRPGEALCDMMAGIGPFAVPAAKRGHTVYANDLNPECARYLRDNASLNKVAHKVFVSNQCGRLFLRSLAAGEGGGAEAVGAATRGAPPPPPPSAVLFHHVVMNLPASAIEFLDAFRGAFRAAHWAGVPLPTVHCYAFLRRGESEEQLRARAEGHLSGRIDCARDEWRVHNVRDVAPNKEMVCLSFRVPPEVAYDDGTGERQRGEGGGASPAGKRLRVDSEGGTADQQHAPPP